MWTQNKLFQPKAKRQPMLDVKVTKAYPILEGYMTSKEMAEILSKLVFTAARKGLRPVHLTSKARDKIVNALLSRPTSVGGRGY